MKIRYKVILFFAALAVLFGAVSCKENGTENETSGSVSGSTSGPAADLTAPNEFWVEIVSAEGTPCTVVYSDSATDNVISAASQLAVLIGALTPSKASATLLPESQYRADSAGAVILVGDTGQSASETFLKKIGYADYGFSVVSENVLCVGSAQSSKCVKALNDLSKMMNASGLKRENGKASGGYYLSSASDSITAASYPVSSFQINGKNANEFVLVSETENLKTARLLQSYIGNASGQYLRVLSPEQAKQQPNRMLVGNTGEESQKAFYEQDYRTSYRKYEWIISGSTVAFHALSDSVLAYAAERFQTGLLAGKTEISLTDANTEKGVCPETVFGVSDRPEAASLRIASNNVYFYNFNEKRVNALEEGILYMDADILLLQEVSTTWHSVLDTDLPALGYTQVPTKADSSDIGAVSNQKNYTPVFYRANKVRLAAYGYDQFESVKLKPDKNHTTSKSYTWAVFDEIGSGKRFAVISTHFTWAPDNFTPTPEQLRTQDAQEVMAKVAAIETEYFCPVIVMGDMNSTEGSQPYAVMASGNLCDAAHNSTATANLNYNTWHDVGSAPVQNGTAIDHCFLSKTRIVSELFQMIVNDYAIQSTDHCPLVVDVRLK